MYFTRVKYGKQNEIESYVSRTINQIKSSVYLLEMSTNPSMLQLLCLLSWKKTINFGKDRTSVFKYYTSYLLRQYHIKLVIKEKLPTTKRYLDNLYHQNLLEAGKVALTGLKQNKLVFSEDEARLTGGDAIFEIGFLTKLPSTDMDDVKVQFTHMTLQEYLAAFYVVNTSFNEGLEILMEFCSTSERKMASKIILEFVSNMSPELEAEIQKLIKDVVLKWDTGKRVNSKSCTSFLISMLEGTETLKFPLPAVIDIDFRYNSFKKPALERFFSMDGNGVRKIYLILDQTNRLNVLQNTTVDSLDELNIANDWWCKSMSKEGNKEMHGVIKKMKPGLLSITNCEWKSMDESTVGVILQHVNTLILENCDLGQEHLLSILRAEHHLKVLKVTDRGVKIDGEVIEAVGKLTSDINLYMFGQMITLKHKADSIKSLSIRNNGVSLKIDTEVAEAVSRLPGHTQIDLSGNQVKSKSACITLIHKAGTIKSLRLCKCGLQIDTEIGEAVTRLPDGIQLDLSGNKLTKMDPRLLPGVLIHMPQAAEIDMTGWEITIDADIVKALSKMPQLKLLKVSDKKLTPDTAIQHLEHLQQPELSNCGINDTICVALMTSLSKHCPLLEVLNLGGNKLTSDEWCHHVKMKKLRKLYLSRCTINDTVCVSLMISLSKHCPLLEVLNLGNEDTMLLATRNVYNNNLTSDEWCPHVQMKQLRKLYLPNCGINDTVCVSLMISLSKHCPLLEVLNLGNEDTMLHVPRNVYNNNLTSDEWCPHVQMKQLRKLNLSYCGIPDTVCVSLMISLFEHCPLLERMDLGGNNLTSDEWCPHVQMKQLRKLYLSNCGINDTVCVSLMISLSKHCPLLEVLNLGTEDTMLHTRNVYNNNLTSDEWCHHVQMKQLRELNLSNCGITDTVCVSLMISLSKHCPLLAALNLSNYSTLKRMNKLTSYEWCPHVQMKQLRKLYLSNCGINDTVCVSLMISLSKHCPLLEVLNLCGNNLRSDVLNILNHITHMKNLRELDLRNNPCVGDWQHRKEVEKDLQISNPGLKVKTKL